MAEQLDRNGYTPWHKVYSGKTQTSDGKKARGVWPAETPIAAFRYSHSLQRLEQLSSSAVDGHVYAGFWTIQAKESNKDGAKVKFEQSVLCGLSVISGAGGLLGTWYIHENYTYKFKTRICNGEFLRPLVEPHDAGRIPVANAGGRGAAPLQVCFWNVKVTSLSVRMPPIPADALFLELQWSKSRYDGFQTLKAQVPPETDVDVNVGDLGITSSNAAVAATELIWVRAVAHYSGGVSRPGEAVRDTWPVIQGTTQVAGYEGWKYLDWPHATPYSEQAILENPGGVGQLVLGEFPEWGSPAWGYNCKLPANPFLDIISDYWVGRISGDDIYYSVAWKPAPVIVEAMTFCAPTGETFYFYVKDGDFEAARVRRIETFNTSERADAKAINGIPQLGRPAGVWSGFTGLCPFVAIATDDYNLYLALTDNRARNWQNAMKCLQNIQVKALWPTERGAAICVVGLASATVVTNDPSAADKDFQQGDVICAVLRLDASNQWTASRLQHTKDFRRVDLTNPIPWDEKPISVTFPEQSGGVGAGVAWLWFATGLDKDVLECFETRDYGFSWKSVPAPNPVTGA